MNFTLIKTLEENERKKLIKFFLKSKPYPFCELPSMSMSLFKIKEYIDFLLEKCLVYVREDFFVAVSFEGEVAIIQFATGKPFKLSSDFEEFRNFLKQTKQIKQFRSIVQRDYKKQKYLNYLKRRDKNIQIEIDNGIIYVIWNT
jgi:hypothetical protein